MQIGIEETAEGRVGARTMASDVARGGRALVWDSSNTAALVVARSLRREGWTVDWIGTSVCPYADSSAFDGERCRIAGPQDPQLLPFVARHPLDALFLCGDDHVRWVLDHWQQLPARLHRHLASPEALRTALSKERTLDLARSLGVPVLPTERCASPEEVAAASLRLAPGGDVVFKGDGGAAGCAVAAIASGRRPDAATWKRVTAFSPAVIVQPRLRGPRVFTSVVYEHGVRRAACTHEKVATFPADFGPTAFGVTRHIPEVDDSVRRMFEALEWHGVANIEFRQSTDDGRWYYMEINPRVNASMGIQEAAGLDTTAIWAAVSSGRSRDLPRASDYRAGVRYAWGVRGAALALRAPWRVPAWGWRCLLGGRSDLAHLDPRHRRRALRLAAWMARHA